MRSGRNAFEHLLPVLGEKQTVMTTS